MSGETESLVKDQDEVYDLLRPNYFLTYYFYFANAAVYSINFIGFVSRKASMFPVVKQLRHVNKGMEGLGNLKIEVSERKSWI